MTAAVLATAGRRTGDSRRRDLAVAGLLAGAGIAALGLLAGWAAGGAPLAARLGVLGLLPAVAGALAGRSLRLRRAAGQLLAGAAALAAVAACATVALGAGLLVLGRTPTAQERGVLLPAVAVAVVAALAAVPLRARAVTAATRVTARRLSPDEVLAGFAGRDGTRVPLEELLRRLAESLVTTLELRSVQVWTGDGTSLDRTLSLPTRDEAVPPLGSEALAVLGRAGVAGEAWVRLWLPERSDDLVGDARPDQVRVVPAQHTGVVLALLVVERAGDADRFRAADERLLADVARALGVVLHNRALDSALTSTLEDLRRANSELRASRSRLVAAADAERRRIERDIHDGAQQHLVALAMGLGLARDLVADDPQGAAELLEQAAADVRETIQQVRDLAHGIYPPLLAESGLREALRAAAARSPSPVTVDVAPVRAEPEVEAAVYFCCLEALQNAAKHAAGAPVTISATAEGGHLAFDVADDGPGFDPQTSSAGHGFQNMADRIGAVGGWVRWESAPGAGVRIHGEVPLAATSGPAVTGAA